MNPFRAACVLLLSIAVLLQIHAKVAPPAASAPGEAAQAKPLSQPRVVAFTLHNTLQPVSASVLEKNLNEANRSHPAAILLDLSSPGGLHESAVAMVQSIRHSAAPVIVFVREPHTKVAGEALLLLNAGAVSAMHPDSQLALSRAYSVWSWQSRKALEQPELLPMLQQERNLSGRTGHPVTALPRGGTPMSGTDAFNANLVDVLANGPERLLNRLDGWQVTANGRQMRLDLQNFAIRPMPPSPGEHLLRAVMNPDLTVLLLTLGSLLIYLEINTPGGVVPGAAGLLLVLLALYAFHDMPLRWEGVALLFVSVCMLFAEANFQQGSAYAVCSVLTLVLGLRLLVRGPIPELTVDWSTAIGAGLGFGGVTAILLLLGVRAKRAKVKVGAEAMVGWLGVTQTPLEPEGQVLVRGELWNARLSSDKASLPAGECVTVQQFKGKVLQVAPLPSPAQAS